MDSEREKKLQETLKDFNKKNKSEIFKFGSEIEDYAVIPSGIEAVDNFLGGGFKRSAHTIIWGGYSVGKTALCLTTIANAQKLGNTVCYVNLEKPIDRDRFEYFGIDLERMVYIEAPNNAEQALEALRTLCKNKVIDMFIIDSIQGLSPKSIQEDKGEKERGLDKANVAALPRTLSQFYNIVNPDVYRAKTAVIWIGQLRTGGIGTYVVRDTLTGGKAQLFYAYQIVNMRRDQKDNNPVQKYKEYFLDPTGKLRFETKEEEIGFSLVLKMDKTNSSKSVNEKKEIVIPFYRATGFRLPDVNTETDIPITIDRTMSKEDQEKVLDMLIEKGIKIAAKKLAEDDKALTELAEDFIKNSDNPTSVVFDGKGDHLTLPNNKDFDLEGKKDISLPKKRGRKPGSKNKKKE